MYRMWSVPKLWTDTVEEHRRAVRDAAMDAVAALVAEHGLAAVTMSKIAAETGIGRATLYKYFPDVEAVLVAWHERLVASHLGQLARIAARDGSPWSRLEAVLAEYARLARGQLLGGDLAALLHRGQHVSGAQHELGRLIAELLAEAAEAGQVRDDVPPGELASYCQHALAAAGGLPSEAAVRRLVAVTMAGLGASPPRS